MTKRILWKKIKSTKKSNAKNNNAKKSNNTLKSEDASITY